jgi:methylmalonyl-CoA/ethylmalonyl-CoA epimerase
MGSRELPEVGQIAIVAQNMEKAVEYYSKMLNIGPFAIFEYAPEKAIMRGQNVSFKLKIGLADWGKQRLEIIEVLEGEPHHSEFLEKTGGGIHHLGFYVDDVKRWIEYFDKKGIPVLMDLEGMAGNNRKTRAVYFETSESGTILEFIQVYKSI